MKIKIYIIVAVILLFSGAGLYWYIQTLKNQINEQEQLISIYNQNENAYKDLLKMKADSIQNLSIFASNLQKDNTELKHKYNILSSKYDILIDSINVLNGNGVIIFDPSDSNKITVSFAGKKGKISYKGSTTYFIIDKNSIYSISIAVDPITILSKIQLDKESNIIKNVIYADGLLIDNVNTEIDSIIYSLIYKGMISNNNLDTQVEKTFFDRLQFLFNVNQKIEYIAPSYVFKEIGINFGIKYDFDVYNIYLHKNILNNYVEAGISYTPSIKDLWKKIFK